MFVFFGRYCRERTDFFGLVFKDMNARKGHTGSIFERSSSMTWGKIMHKRKTTECIKTAITCNILHKLLRETDRNIERNYTDGIRHCLPIFRGIAYLSLLTSDITIFLLHLVYVNWIHGGPNIWESSALHNSGLVCSRPVQWHL